MYNNGNKSCIYLNYIIDNTAFWIVDLGTPMPRLGSGISSILPLQQVCFYFIHNLTLSEIN